MKVVNKMQITINKEDRNELYLIWEGEIWKKVHKPLTYRRLKPILSVATFEEAEKVFAEIEEKAARSFSVASLAKKGLLVSELVEKLKKRGISDESINAAVSFCRKIGALDDKELIELRIQSELRKGKGINYIKERWRKALSSHEMIHWDSQENRKLEKDSALQLMRKKRKKEKPFDWKERQSIYFLLQRRGFRREIIEEVLNAEVQ